MSEFEIKREFVSREGQPAPFYETTKIPIIPRKRQCVGEVCPYKESEDCWPTRHHLFFEHEAYKALGYPYDVLVKDPHASVMISRCRHNSNLPSSWHKLYRYTELPSEEVAIRFIEESQLLQGLSVMVKDMSEQINSIFDTDPKSKWQVFGTGKYQRKIEYFEEKFGVYGDAVKGVKEFEVMPASIVGGLVSKLGESRNQLQEKVLVVPELAKMVLREFSKVA